MIEIYAGKTALERIKQEGFKQELFTTFIGASGGPKWFSLYSWDKYLFGEFFKNRSEKLDIIGSSAGAFRAACFAQNDPVAAIERLAKNYSETVYSKKADRQEISDKAIDLLDIMLGENGIDEILNNPVFKAHFFVAKANGFTASENKAIQGLGLLKSYVYNCKDRQKLKSQYERFVFQAKESGLNFTDPDNIATQTVEFTEQNLKPALLASGSIPMVMAGIKDIPDCPKGMYRDGGIIDYHFDLKINTDGLALYPHFNSAPKAGWFDKNLKRGIRPENYDNIVMLCPSPKFIATLPYQKIPDRTDFTEMEDQQRIGYWRDVFKATEMLADDLIEFIDKQDFSIIKPIS